MNSNFLDGEQQRNWSENTWSTMKEHEAPITFPYVRPDKETRTVTFFCPISVTYNALMLIEMLLLCYAARYVYYVDLEREEETTAVEATDRSKDKSMEQANSTNNNEANRQPSALTAWDFLLDISDFTNFVCVIFTYKLIFRCLYLLSHLFINFDCLLMPRIYLIIRFYLKQIVIKY